MKWMVILGVAGVFALGAILLSKKQIVVNLPASANGTMAMADASDMVATGTAPSSANGGKSRPTLKAAAVAPSASSSMSEVDEQVGGSLDALKDRLFRLELRRQAGTITEAEYVEERNKAEQVLRELVKG